MEKRKPIVRYIVTDGHWVKDRLLCCKVETDRLAQSYNWSDKLDPCFVVRVEVPRKRGK